MKLVSGKDLCKVLERKGWQRERISSSHHIYRRSGDPVLISVPVHGNRVLGRGLQTKLMKQAGLGEEDL